MIELKLKFTMQTWCWRWKTKYFAVKSVGFCVTTFDSYDNDKMYQKKDNKII